ncbi:MAG TPA: GNAT family N-acetyltransferase [Spirochaetales bacterium]|nr:GNAT family N-acetyltransferase [Spirochaetales bacterium]
MNIEFRELDDDNFDECVALAVRADQPFVASNMKSLAQACINRAAVPRAIYVEGAMVGFLMYLVDRGGGELYLWRFMMDKGQQGKGYGTAALGLLERIARAEPGVVRMRLSTSPDNANGIKVYTKFGFMDTGILDDGEEVFVKELR